MNTDIFYQHRILPIESRLLNSDVALLLQGEDVRMKEGTSIPEIEMGGQILSNRQMAHLFLLCNGSRIWRDEQEESNDETLAGFYINSVHAQVELPHAVRVGLYHFDDSAQGQWDGVFIDSVFWRPTAPKYLGTVSFALLAIQAYALGLTEIRLLAGGGAAKFANHWTSRMQGYFVWPKLGFDAPIDAQEVTGVTHLQNCRSVQEVLAIDANWWRDNGGNGRMMLFDLSAGSKSWLILLDYLKMKLDTGEIK